MKLLTHSIEYFPAYANMVILMIWPKKQKNKNRHIGIFRYASRLRRQGQRKDWEWRQEQELPSRHIFLSRA